MNASAEPDTPEALAEAVRSFPRVLARGAGTKPALASAEGFASLSTRRLTGIREYDPSEFTFTALAGTTLAEIAAALEARGQYLPFDPPLAAAGATLGGTTAAGLEGPGRFRFGGLRDFILGVRFVDGEGRLLRLGGKVVKNAAGFDVPKFLVGSLGSFGVLAEVSFKVFPRPKASCTVAITVSSLPALARLLQDAGSSPWEIDAAEASLGSSHVAGGRAAADLIPPDQAGGGGFLGPDGPAQGPVAYLRLTAPTEAIGPVSAQVLRRWPGRLLTPDEHDRLWRDVSSLAWAPPDWPCWKLVLTPTVLPAFATLAGLIDGSRAWVGAGGHVAWLALPPQFVSQAEAELRKGGWTALSLRGPGPRWRGLPPPDSPIRRAVKAAFDPANRFASLSNPA